jgi:hypothetical protein
LIGSVVGLLQCLVGDGYHQDSIKTRVCHIHTYSHFVLPFVALY